MYAHIHASANACMHTRTHAHTHACTHARAHTHTHTHTHNYNKSCKQHDIIHDTMHLPRWQGTPPIKTGKLHLEISHQGSAGSTLVSKCCYKNQNKRKQSTNDKDNSEKHCQQKPTPAPNQQHFKNPPHLFLGLHLHCVLLDFDHQFLRLLRGLDELWLEVCQLLLHDRDLGGSKVQFVQAHQVAVLHLGDVAALHPQQALEGEDQL